MGFPFFGRLFESGTGLSAYIVTGRIVQRRADGTPPFHGIARRTRAGESKRFMGEIRGEKVVFRKQDIVPLHELPSARAH
ncbi:hypothetical protein, partial [Shinella sumterensis]|uniref:hypothetical protein n=1 Tax=Shinella sumterensis TaxID=1967501 RepID=UPI003F84CDC2